MTWLNGRMGVARVLERQPALIHTDEKACIRVHPYATRAVMYRSSPRDGER